VADRDIQVTTSSCPSVPCWVPAGDERVLGTPRPLSTVFLKLYGSFGCHIFPIRTKVMFDICPVFLFRVHKITVGSEAETTGNPDAASGFPFQGRGPGRVWAVSLLFTLTGLGCDPHLFLYLR
jgi:hypothetical protein